MVAKLILYDDNHYAMSASYVSSVAHYLTTVDYTWNWLMSWSLWEHNFVILGFKPDIQTSSTFYPICLTYIYSNVIGGTEKWFE